MAHLYEYVNAKHQLLTKKYFFGFISIHSGCVEKVPSAASLHWPVPGNPHFSGSLHPSMVEARPQ